MESSTRNSPARLARCQKARPSRSTSPLKRPISSPSASASKPRRSPLKPSFMNTALLQPKPLTCKLGSCNMNKSTVLVLCSVVAALAARAEPLKTDRDFDRLKGKVHQVSHGNLMPSMRDKSTNGESETYDERGNLIANVEVGADSYLRHTYVHVDTKMVLEYWSEDPSIPDDSADASHLSAKYVYKYDGKGNRIERSDFDKKGTLTFLHKYLYDPKGRRISESTEVDKEVRDLVKFTYDKDGN